MTSPGSPRPAAGDIVGLLLCGGAGRRFDGGDKLMAGDEPVAARAARALAAATPHALAVIPPGRGALRAALERAGCEALESEATARGMGASLAAGVAATRGAAGWIVALGDMPAVRPETIGRVRDALESGAALAAPFDAAGRRGHPVGFSRAFGEALAALDGDTGARELLARHEAALVRVAADDPGIFIDVDTREDLARLGS